MEKRVRNMAILAAISVVFLMLLIVGYANTGSSKKERAGATPAQEAALSAAADPYKAFLNDPHFFDGDEEAQPTQAAQPTQSRPRLYVKLGSVARDIRVTVTDEAGRPMSGYSFHVTVDPLGEYKDLDQDGQIYIPDVDPGDYFVELAHVPGYEIPTEPLRVSVKEELEYVVIDDISLYIRSEDEVDAVKEDTRENEAAEDADETERNTRWSTDAAFGIDVSSWQKDIDWNAVASDGVEFAIIRCGYRGCTQGSLIEDTHFKQNLDGAKAAGLGVGVYFFTQALNEVEAVEEASMVATLLKGYKLEYPVFIDVEGAGGNGRADNLSARQRTAVVAAFCRTIESAGFNAGVYSGRLWFNDKLNDNELGDYVHWLAEYRESPLYTGRFSLWQYSSGGTINGINTRVDLDIVWDGGVG